MSETAQYVIVSKFPQLYRLMENQRDSIKWACLRKNPMYYNEIQNPSLSMSLFAVNYNAVNEV